MLGTARVVGQTLGTTLAAMMFRLFDQSAQSGACLVAGIVMAVTAAVVSIMRRKG